MKKSKFILGLLMAAFVLASSMTLYSCYPYGSTNPEEYDVYLTLHKEDLNGYKNYRTYMMRDSVEHLDGGTGRTYDATILSKVAANLSSLGYTRLTNLADTAVADLIVTNAITSATSYYVDYYYPGGYYGYGYGYYYPYSTVYTVSTGTVITTMIDKKAYQPGTDKSPAVWMGVLNGVTTGDVSTTTTRVSQGIDRVFSQSPYLKVN